MASTLQDAITAVRQGNVELAQRELAEVIAANPDEVQAWYLLSQLVDSDARRAAYLSKTLALDPFHERAWAEFFSLPTDVVSQLEPGQAPTTFVMPSAASATAFPVIGGVDVALSADAAGAIADVAVPSVAAAPAVTAAVASADAEAALPDWLRPVVKDQPVIAQKREPAAKPVSQPQPAAVQPEPAEAAAQGNKALSALLAILVIATILVLAFLVYLLLQS